MKLNEKKEREKEGLNLYKKKKKNFAFDINS
jgi:hypothetical protein